MKLPAILALIFAYAAVADEQPSGGYWICVSNERSNDVSILDGASNAVVATIPVGKRPRGIHASPDGKRLYIAVSGSPRMAPGVDRQREPADKTADGIAIVDLGKRAVLQKLNVGSDPEQFAISADGAFAYVANEDVATASVIE